MPVRCRDSARIPAPPPPPSPNPNSPPLVPAPSPNLSLNRNATSAALLSDDYAMSWMVAADRQSVTVRREINVTGVWVGWALSTDGE